jgi:hypothetical protein
VNSESLFVAVFRATLGVGLVKYYADPILKRIARQLRVAQERTPGTGLDLSLLNLADATPVFRRK